MKTPEDIVNRFIKEEGVEFDQERDDWVLEAMREYAEIASNTEIIGSVMPCFEFSGKATKYNQGVAVDTDGIALSNDILPHKAYTLEEGVEYTVKLYKV